MCVNLYLLTNQTSQISLEGEWQFKEGEYSLGEQFTECVILPGTMDTNEKGFENKLLSTNQKENTRIYNVFLGTNPEKNKLTERLYRKYTYTGKAVYARTVSIPSNWAGKNISLHLERSRETRVWINHTYAGWNNSLGTAQVYNISDQIIPGIDNVIVVEVNNSNYCAGDWMTPRNASGDWITDSHMATDETTTNWNGIIGKIQLHAKESVSIKSVRVYPNIANQTTKIKLIIESLRNTEGTITIQVTSASTENSNTAKKVCLGFKTTGLETYMEYDYYLGPDVKLWSEFTPELYNLKVALIANNAELKSTTIVKFGMREFKVAPNGKQFTINNRITFLRGECNCNVFPVTGYGFMDKESWKSFLNKLKIYGINYVRFHSWCPPEAAFEAADELGIYMQPELYLFGGPEKDPFSTYNTYAYMKEEGERILNVYANHPSFIMLSFGNETAVTDLRKIDLYHHFKKLDSSRLYSEGSNTFYWDNAIGDRNIGDYRAASSTNLGHCRELYYFEDHAPATTLNYDDKILEMKKPFMGFEAGQYQIYPDYNEISKYEHTVFKPTNLEYFRDLLVAKNMIQQNMDFHKASGKWAAILYREEIEAFLRTSLFSGYQMLSFQDFPGQGTALVGLYDSFMESKNIISPEEFKRCNTDIVLLAEMSKFIWTTDENFSAKIKIANYSATQLCNTDIYYCLKCAGDTIASGNLGKVDIQEGGLFDLGKISLSLEGITSSVKLVFEIGIADTMYLNRYDLWAYPAEMQTSIPSDVYVTQYYDEATKRALMKGGKVLLVPSSGSLNPAKSVSSKFMVDFWSKAYHDYSKCDSYTLGLLIDAFHIALTGFPTDFHSNWQWYDLIKNSRSIILDDAPVALKPIVQTIDHFDRNLKLGNIFEANVSNGKMLVCAFDLLGQIAARPEVRQLYKSLLTYMNGSLFKPTERLNENFFEMLII